MAYIFFVHSSKNAVVVADECVPGTCLLSVEALLVFCRAAPAGFAKH